MNESLYSILARFQHAIRAPKDKVNNFGKYNYRNAESILEAIKDTRDSEGKTLADYGCCVILRESICEFASGSRFYVKAEAILCRGSEQIGSSSYAQEAAEKKGMDQAQITGAATSYARKYALGGLFAIDDSKDDPDSTNTHQVKRFESKDACLKRFEACTSRDDLLKALSDSRGHPEYNTLKDYAKSMAEAKGWTNNG